MLYNYADKGNVLVLDDCDTVLYDETSQTCLKRHLTVAKNVRLVGTQIVLYYVEKVFLILLNLKVQLFLLLTKFDKVRGKLKDPTMLLYVADFDLTLDTTREKMLRCKQIVADGMLNEYGFSKAEQAEVIDFMFDNKDRMREICVCEW